MGWGSGSSLAEDIWELVREFIPEKKRRDVARDFVELFEDRDCDTMDEATTLIDDAELWDRWAETE